MVKVAKKRLFFDVSLFEISRFLLGPLGVILVTFGGLLGPLHLAVSGRC